MSKTMTYPVIKISTILLIILSVLFLSSGCFASPPTKELNQTYTHLAKGQRASAPDRIQSCA